MKTCSRWSIMIHLIIDVILHQNRQSNKKMWSANKNFTAMEWFKILTFSISSMTSSMVIIPTTSSTLGSFNRGLSQIKFKISGWDSPDHLLLLEIFSFPGKTLEDDDDDDVLIIDCLKLLLCEKFPSPSISNLTSSPKYTIFILSTSVQERKIIWKYRDYSVSSGNVAHC